mgnify:CR=1 FL=1
MSTYNRFGTPRAYIDSINYDLTTGWRDLGDIVTIQNDNSTDVVFDNGTSEGDMFDLKPSNFAQIANTNQSFYIQFDTGTTNVTLAESNYIAILNHNFKSADAVFKLQYSSVADFSANVTTITTTAGTGTGQHQKIVNCGSNMGGGNADFLQSAKNGWTLLTWTTQTTNNRYIRLTVKDSGGAGVNFATDVFIGSIMIGEYIDFPQTPELDIKTSVSYEGSSTQTSLGGNTYSSSTHLGQPTWAITTPWNLSTTSNQQTYSFLKRHGRINHSLQFKYLADTDVFSSVAGLESTSGTNWHDSGSLHNSFFNKIIGNRLPFLFVIDNSSTSVGDYGMFRLADNKFSVSQVASQVYDMSLNLTETW